MTTDTSHLIARPDEEYERLRDAIAHVGQQYAIKLAPDGSIVDGNQRMKACGELGLIPWTETIDVGTDPLAIEARALLLNAETERHHVPSERDRIVLGLHERGKTLREIVAETGVSMGTVQRTIRSRPRAPLEHEVPEEQRTDIPRRTDSRGRRQAVRRTTAVELERRDVIIADLYRRGHSTREIADGLGVVSSVISHRIQKLGINDPKRHVGVGPVEGFYPWRDADVPSESESRWRQSRVIAMVKMLDDEFRETTFASALANQVLDALDAEDDRWVEEATATVAAALEKLERARLILTDATYRLRCRDTFEGVEELRSRTPRRLMSVSS